MSDARQVLDYQSLRNLFPFNQVPPHRLGEVVGQFTVEQLPAGRYLFKQGDRDNRTVYLLKGKVELESGGAIIGTVSADTDAARHPLAHQQPRQSSALTKTKVTIARIDSALLDFLLTADQSSQYEITEIETSHEGDWLTRILQSKAFLRLPTANIQKMMKRMEPVEVHAGDTVVREGDEGDYYYIIKQGLCAVTRRDAGSETTLAELHDGDGFGEEALLSGRRRGATLTMKTDGTLLRLPKQDFLDLLIAPLLTQVSYPDAAALVQQGAVWLDVRPEDEYRQAHIEGSLNIPLAELRNAAADLDPKPRYIACCATGRHAAAAAFLLSERGFDVCMLAGGLKSAPADTLTMRAAQPPQPEAAPPKPKAPAAKPAAGNGAPPPEGNAEPARLRSELEQVRRRAEAQLAQYKNQTKAYVENLKRETATAVEQADQARQSAERKATELEQALAQSRRAQEELTAARDGAERALHQSKDEGERIGKELAALHQRLEQAERTAAEHERAHHALEEEAGLLRLAMENAGKAHDETLATLRNELSALKAETQKDRARSAALRQENEHLNAERTGLEKARRAAEQESARLRTELDEARGERDATLAQLSTEIASLEAALQTAQARAAALAEQQREAESAGQQADAETARLRAELESAQQAQATALARLESEIDTLNTELQRAQADAEAAGQQAQTETARLREELATLTARLQQAEQAAATAEQARAALEQSARERDETLARLQSDRTTLEAELAEEQARAAALGEEKHEAEATAQQADTEAARLRTELDASLQARDAEATRLGSEIAALKTGLQDAQAQAAALEERKQQAEAAQQLASGEAARLHAELEALASRVARTGEADAATEQARAALERELEQLHAQLEQAGRERDEAAATLAAREAELQAAREQAAALAEEQAAVEAEWSAAETRLTRITEEHRAHRAALEQEIAALEARLRQAAEETEKAIGTALAERIQAEEQAGQLAAEAEALRKQLADAEQARNETERARREADERLAAMEAHPAKPEVQGEETTALEREIADLRARLDAAIQENREQAARHEAGLVQAQGETEQALQERLTQLEADTAQERDRLQQALAAAEERARQQARLHEEAETALTGAQQIAATLQVELDALHARTREASPPPGGASDEADRLRAELARLEQDNRRLDTTRRDTEETLFTLRQTLADLKHQAEDEARRRERIEEDAAALRRELEHAQALSHKPEPLIALSHTLPPPAAPAAIRNNGTRGARRHRGVRRVLIPAVGLLLAALAAATLWLAHREGLLTQYLPWMAAPEQEPVAQEETAQPGAATPDEEPQATPKPKRVGPVRTLRDTLQDGGSGPAMVALPGGSFAMGSSSGSPHFDERPQHDVTVKRFAIGKYEVTFTEYDAFAAAAGRARPRDQGWGRGERPVVNVTWRDAKAYADWLSQQTGQRYRLPTEAEWEYAARAGGDTLYWWGTEPVQGKAVCFDCGSRWDGRQTAPAGSLKANAFGLHDMAGNAEEWVQDCHHPNYEGAPADARVWDGGDCGQRIARGGSYRNTKTDLRSARRTHYAADTRLDTLGFRVVREY